MAVKTVKTVSLYPWKKHVTLNRLEVLEVESCVQLKSKFRTASLEHLSL